MFDPNLVSVFDDLAKSGKVNGPATRYLKCDARHVPVL